VNVPAKSLPELKQIRTLLTKALLFYHVIIWNWGHGTIVGFV